jgi:hypothetical protein
MAGGRQDQNLNVTRKIFLEAHGVIKNCVKPSFWGKVFRAHWKFINSCSQVYHSLPTKSEMSNEQQEV